MLLLMLDIYKGVTLSNHINWQMCTVVNNEELSPQEELVQDIVSILHIFSCRLYGLRKYKKQIKEDEDIAKELQDGNKSNIGTENQDW